jgi:AraC family transcriptional regulator
MTPESAAAGRGADRQKLMRSIGRDVSRFQEATYAFDDVAANILALSRSDLPCMTLLLFNGPASVEELGTILDLPRAAVTTIVERLQLAGYARVQPDAAARIELTEHARRWIARIWSPLQQDGRRLLGGHSTRDLALIGAFLRQACEVQELRTRKLRAWLALPRSPARKSHLRGGLSPAALRRVQLFVEGNLGRTIHLADLAARAGLSAYHFARAFKTSAGMTPRAFIEHRRVERARQLLQDTARPVAEIAIETGFGTQSRLTTVFRRRTGFTPAAYRRARR